MSDKKPSLAARIIGGAIHFVIDNVMLVCALISILAEKPIMAIWFMVFAFYERVTEIRDAVRSNDVQISLNASGPINLTKLEG